MGVKASKETIINAEDLSKLQTLSVNHGRCCNNTSILDGFFLNNDIDCLILEETPYSQLRRSIHEAAARKPKQKYRFFKHPSRSNMLCVIKKNSKTTKTSLDWTEDYHDCCNDDKEDVLLETLLKNFFEDETVARFTVRNFDSSKYSMFDGMVNLLKNQYPQYDVWLKSQVAQQTMLNCTVEKLSKYKPSGTTTECY